MHGHQPNLLPKRRTNKLRILQVATGVAVVVSASMVWSLVMSGSAHTRQTASIGAAMDTTSTPLPALGRQQTPKALSTGPVYAPALDSTNQDSIRYFDGLGRAFSVNPDSGTAVAISDVKIQGFVNGWWLPGSSQAIIEVQQGTGTDYRWHDFSTGQTSDLGTDIDALTVSRDGRSIAFFATNGDHRAIYTSNADGTARHAVLQTRIVEDALSWPTNDMLALTSRRPDQTGWDLSMLGVNGWLTFVLANQENLSTTWSRDGKQVLYSAFVATQGVELFVHDLTLGTDMPMGLTTSADKCAWTPDGARIVCGVPVGTGLTSDVSASKTATVDAIVSIDTATGTQTTIWTPPSGTLLGVINPVITASGNSFVFTNLFDHRLFSVSI
ncbi:MAG TPA: hypothetical protein VMU12_03235 [Candidatus Paceibacterota bacterium]|nr:hypothetical protein [Candidatus Paceibacterota bacterium]